MSDEKKKEEKPKGARAQLKDIAKAVEQKRQEANEKLERLLAMAKAAGC